MRRIGIDYVIRVGKQKRAIVYSIVDAGNFVLPFRGISKPLHVFPIVRIKTQVTQEIVEGTILHHDDDNGFNEAQIYRHDLCDLFSAWSAIRRVKYGI